MMKKSLALVWALQSNSKVSSFTAISAPFNKFSDLTTRNMATKALAVDPFCFRQFAEHEASKKYGGAVL
jgi:hypothetical protein